VGSGRGMPGQRVENERSGCCEHRVRMAKGKQRSNAPPFSTLAGDFERQLVGVYNSSASAPAACPDPVVLERREECLHYPVEE